MTKGIDTTNDVTSHLGALKTLGITFVARYMSHSAWKNITKAEAKAISDAGLSIVSVWESAGDHKSFFTSEQGRMDGAAAFHYAQSIGQPFTAPIYFAVDYDAHVDDVSGYFQGVRWALQKNGEMGVKSYKCGVYGSGEVCKQLKMMGLVTYCWKAQSTGWAGYAFDDWNIMQEPATTVAHMSVDTDISRGNGGGWKL